MKLILVAIVSLLALHCKQSQSIDKDAIIGSWTTVVSPKSDPDIHDSMVFVRPDILKIYWKMKDRVVDSLNGSFKMQDKLLLITRHDSTYVHDILELNSKSMATRLVSGRLAYKFKRLN